MQNRCYLQGMNSREIFTFYMCTLGNWCYSKWARISLITRNIFFIKKQVQNNISSMPPSAFQREWIFKCVFAWLHIKYIWKSLQILIVPAAGGKGTGCGERDSPLVSFSNYGMNQPKKEKKSSWEWGRKKEKGPGCGEAAEVLGQAFLHSWKPLGVLPRVPRGLASQRSRQNTNRMGCIILLKREKNKREKMKAIRFRGEPNTISGNKNIIKIKNSGYRFNGILDTAEAN